MGSLDALKVAIITENFLPKVDGVTVTLAQLLEHLSARGVKAILLGPVSGMNEYAGCRIFGAFGFPLPAYPGLKINFIPPSFIRELQEFDPDVIHLIDPIWLGVQALTAIKILFPNIPLVTSQDTNLPTYATVFGFPYFRNRIWKISSYVHSFGQFTLVPSPSTASLLKAKGFVNIRICDRGVNPEWFSPALRNHALRRRWGLNSDDIAILSAGRVSPEKNLQLLIESSSLLSKDIRDHVVIVFVGDGPLTPRLRELCTTRDIRALFLGQLTGEALWKTFASADIMSSPSFTETFGQVTLEAMASGLPVAGLYAEGTVDLVTHLGTGLLLDVHAGDKTHPWKPYWPLDVNAQIATYDSCADLMRPSSTSFQVIARQYASLLELLISDHALRAEMGAAGLLVAQEYPWERCTDRILSTYMDALRTRTRAPHVASNSGLLRFFIHALIVGLSIFVAALSHLSYMIPTLTDLAC
ncbi:glycosyl transferase group 1 [Mycena maculata]|uniref:Glycosyl transferase group 1 n=1 Tax=Mycena maculata TaxID=230809 RepID=A0AAD7MM38_9AGAR|nr:glycosyl transferase group 1 [Mycena maculata]